MPPNTKKRRKAVKTAEEKYGPFIGKPVELDRDSKTYHIRDYSTSAEYKFVGIHRAEVLNKKKIFAILELPTQSLMVINYRQLIIKST